MGCAGEKTLCGMVVAVDPWMRHSRKHRELPAMIGKQVEVRARRHATSRAAAGGRLGGEEKLRHHAKGHVNREQSARQGGSRRKAGTTREHGIEQRQSNAGPCRAQERSPGECSPSSAPQAVRL